MPEIVETESWDVAFLREKKLIYITLYKAKADAGRKGLLREEETQLTLC